MKFLPGLALSYGPPISASQGAGIAAVSHCTQPDLYSSLFFTPYSIHNSSQEKFARVSIH
jgi:hypothetical protein